MVRPVLISEILSKRLDEADQIRVDEIIEKINSQLEKSEDFSCSFVLRDEKKSVSIAVATAFKNTKNVHNQIGWRVKLVLSDLVTSRIEISAF